MHHGLLPEMPVDHPKRVPIIAFNNSLSCFLCNYRAYMAGCTPLSRPLWYHFNPLPWSDPSHAITCSVPAPPIMGHRCGPVGLSWEFRSRPGVKPVLSDKAPAPGHIILSWQGDFFGGRYGGETSLNPWPVIDAYAQSQRLV